MCELDGESFNFELEISAKFIAIDEKVINAFVQNSATTRCPICLVTWKGFKDMSSYDFDHDLPQIAERLEFGFSSLHFTINVFEFLSKIAQNEYEKILFQH